MYTFLKSLLSNICCKLFSLNGLFDSSCKLAYFSCLLIFKMNVYWWSHGTRIYQTKSFHISLLYYMRYLHEGINESNRIHTLQTFIWMGYRRTVKSPRKNADCPLSLSIDPQLHNFCSPNSHFYPISQPPPFFLSCDLFIAEPTFQCGFNSFGILPSSTCYFPYQMPFQQVPWNFI